MLEPATAGIGPGILLKLLRATSSSFLDGLAVGRRRATAASGLDSKTVVGAVLLLPGWAGRRHHWAQAYPLAVHWHSRILGF